MHSRRKTVHSIRRRLLAKSRIFDASSVGYRPRLGAMGKLGQLDRNWLASVVDAADAAGADAVLLPLDLARAAARHLDEA